MEPQNNEMVFEPDEQIFLAYPCYGAEVKSCFMLSVINLLTSTNAVAKMDIIANDSLVSRARNTHAARFLASTHPITGRNLQWLMFIDTDIEFQPQHVATLLRAAIKNKDAVTCGMYALKQTRPHFVCNALPGQSVDSEGLIQVREGGTGFMLIHRSVLEKMIAAYPEIEFVCDSNEGDRETRWDFFSVGPYFDKVQKIRRYLSEDYYFCQRWRDMGGRVLMHTRIQCRHHGNMTFPIPESEIDQAKDVYLRAAKLMENRAGGVQ